MKTIGIYVHFPFCKSKCKYCDFNSYAGKDNLQKDYVKTLLIEIENVLKNREIIVDTIFIGGGTPSFMFNGAISKVLSIIKKYSIFDDNIEISIESNPNSINDKKVKEWKNAGINRVSIGLQSSNEIILKEIGRIHNLTDYKNAINTLVKYDFKNINTDIMVGLPHQTIENLKETIDVACEHSTHISCYDLIIEKNTQLIKEIKENKIIVPNEDEKYELSNFAKGYLIEKGFKRYEVSNFAKKEFECKHNLNCWNFKEYIGFGAGAHSFINCTRFSNEKSIENYIKLIKSYGTATKHKHKETLTQLFETYLMLGLRKIEGVNLTLLKEKFNVDLKIHKKNVIEKLQANKLIEIKNNYLKATDLGIDYLNKVILDLVD